MNVQHTSLLGDSQRVLRGDLLPAAHLLNGGVNDDVVQGLIAGSLSAREFSLGRGGEQNIKQRTVALRAVGVSSMSP